MVSRNIGDTSTAALPAGFVLSPLWFRIPQAAPPAISAHRVLVGARNTQSTSAAIDALDFNRSASAVIVLPLELSDLNTVKTFSSKVLEILGRDNIDFLYMNAALAKDATLPTPNGSKWCEALVVNHTSQHYLVHLLREKLIFSKSRLIFVSSSAICSVTDPSRPSFSYQILSEAHSSGVLEKDLAAPSNANQFTIYGESKFVNFLGAQWWRRKLANQCRVVAVSPGFVPGTGLSRHSKESLPTNHPDAKSIPEGAASLNAALFRDDFPEDPEQIS
ncbi:hypothetical protein N7476_005035 [Penicillium atrosanguineum]|uniref:Uncharacterized protein n=1 Tax=Penicillium atrosanguineum TaxID=1132637 RepID=A0A9W9Q1V5_9EURO|nr:hypothetical protein N7476_005035 [Penicillium atrosanguineum]